MFECTETWETRSVRSILSEIMRRYDIILMSEIIIKNRWDRIFWIWEKLRNLKKLLSRKLKNNFEAFNGALLGQSKFDRLEQHLCYWVSTICNHRSKLCLLSMNNSFIIFFIAKITCLSSVYLQCTSMVLYDSSHPEKASNFGRFRLFKIAIYWTRTEI